MAEIESDASADIIGGLWQPTALATQDLVNELLAFRGAKILGRTEKNGQRFAIMIVPWDFKNQAEAEDE